jgi:hypothetical protein
MSCRSVLHSVLAAVLLGLSACAAKGSEDSGGLPDADPELAAYLHEQADAYQEELARLPRDLGVGVSVAAYDTVVELTFQYLDADYAKAADIARFTNSLLMNQVCADAKRRQWMARGVIFRFSFRDRNDALALRSDADHETCGIADRDAVSTPS